jgi:hypothetical protein
VAFARTISSCTASRHRPRRRPRRSDRLVRPAGEHGWGGARPGVKGPRWIWGELTVYLDGSRWALLGRRHRLDAESHRAWRRARFFIVRRRRGAGAGSVTSRGRVRSFGWSPFGIGSRARIEPVQNPRAIHELLNSRWPCLRERPARLHRWPASRRGRSPSP